MADPNQAINSKFAQIEAKLKNSFKAIKEDISSMKVSLDSKFKPASPAKTESYKKDIENLKDLMNQNLNEIKSQLKDRRSIEIEGEALSTLTKEIQSLRAELVTRPDLEKTETRFTEHLSSLRKELDQTREDLEKKQEEVRKTISKSGLKETIHEELSQKIHSQFKEMTEELDVMKKEVTSSMEEFKLVTRQYKSEVNSSTKKEINSLKKTLVNYENKVEDKLKEKDEQMSNLSRQISYLKGRVNKVSKTPQDKKDENSSRPRLLRYVLPIIVLLVLALGAYFFAQRYLLPENKTYFYEFNSQPISDSIYPVSQFSDPIEEDNITFRNLSMGNVYLDIPYQGSDRTINITVKFKDVFTSRGILLVSAPEDEVNYTHQVLFNHSMSSSFTRGQWITSSATFEADKLYLNQTIITLVFNLSRMNRGDSMVDLPIQWINISTSKSNML